MPGAAGRSREAFPEPRTAPLRGKAPEIAVLPEEGGQQLPQTPFDFGEQTEVLTGAVFPCKGKKGTDREQEKLGNEQAFAPSPVAHVTETVVPIPTAHKCKTVLAGEGDRPFDRAHAVGVKAFPSCRPRGALVALPFLLTEGRGIEIGDLQTADLPVPGDANVFREGEGRKSRSSEQRLLCPAR